MSKFITNNLLCLFFSASTVLGQSSSVTISGIIKEKSTSAVIPYVNVILKTEKDSAFISGTISNEEGRFTIAGIKSGSYFLECSFVGYNTSRQLLFVGALSSFLDVAAIELSASIETLNEITVTANADEVNGKMDKKTFSVDNNISQSGGSVLQSMQNLPGITVQDGKVQLRGSDNVIVLIDGKQTALTGMGSQSGLDNIPASAIEKIEIINNPSSKFDANGSAGIINIVYRKNKKNGFNGKLGITGGAVALWERKQNLPGIRPQYQFTPKINPSLSVNYRKNKINLFFQGDFLYTQTLNKNEFVKRFYDDSVIINQQLKRNRNTSFITTKTGADWNINTQNTITVSGLFGTEKIIDRGDEPFYNSDLSEQLRLWQFTEDELKITAMANFNYQHKFKQAGHQFNTGFNYTFHREDEKYFFDNILPAYSGKDSFKLLSDEHVADFNFDYVRPLKYGRMELGAKFRWRQIPTNMQFIPGYNSPLDTNAGGWATYKEIIPAMYATYVFESKKVEAEMGLRVEYVNLNYEVNPNHKVYKSDGYNYTQPFPTARLAYKMNDRNKISFFYNRRVDRPNEVDIRIFPKYDDAEIIKVGNPALRPQFTNTFELGYKTNWKGGYFYSAAYHRIADGTITRIAGIVPGSTLIYAVFQNANKSYTTGLETILLQDVAGVFSFSININAYKNSIEAFSVENKYPVSTLYSSTTQQLISGNSKLNTIFHFTKKTDVQLSAVYLAPDIIPQGKIDARYSIDFGIKKIIQNGKGELFMNATDLANSMAIKKEIIGDGFHYLSSDFYETQVVRVGYSYKF